MEQEIDKLKNVICLHTGISITTDEEMYILHHAIGLTVGKAPFLVNTDPKTPVESVELEMFIIEVVYRYNRTLTMRNKHLSFQELGKLEREYWRKRANKQHEIAFLRKKRQQSWNKTI